MIGGWRTPEPDQSHFYFMLTLDKQNFFVKKGIYFGYPECCIKDFISRPDARSCTPEQNAICNYKGFIPCQKHAIMILKGECTFESIIENRICETPYPNG